MPLVQLEVTFFPRNWPDTVWCHFCEQCLKYFMGSRVAERLLSEVDAQEVLGHVLKPTLITGSALGSLSVGSDPLSGAPFVT